MEIKNNTGKNSNAMFKISYGLYTLFAKDGDKDNGCIINTVNQITDSPKRITIAVNKNNLTCEIIEKTGEFNISVLTEETPFDVFKHFGFQSGKEVDKCSNYSYLKRYSNGIFALDKYSNATISAKVISKTDFETHTLFVAEVTESEVISDIPSVTYAYYLNKIKPQVKTEKTGYVCKICGYIYEGSELPKDFICPICKHGIEDFEKITK